MFLSVVLIHFITYSVYLSFITFDHDENSYNVIMTSLYAANSFTFIYGFSFTSHKDTL